MTKSVINLSLDGIVFGLQTYGGISNYWGRLQRYMDADLDVNCEVILPKRLKFAEYDAIWHANSVVNRETIPSKFSRYLNAREYNIGGVFHSSYYRLPVDRTPRYVVTVYDFIYERYRNGPAQWVHTWQKLRSIRRADAVICISKATRDDVLRYVPDINPARVHVIYLGVDQNLFFPEIRLDTNEFKNTVLYVGQRGGYKRFDLAVMAVAQCNDLTIGIVGPELSPAELVLLDSRLNGRWRWFGAVSGSKLRELYSTVFAFIFPSDYEGFGLPILEAMACGCPVVAANTSSLPEVGGQVALYAVEQRPEAYAVSLVRLRYSAFERQEIILAGLQHVKNFLWERNFSETLSIYRDESIVGNY